MSIMIATPAYDGKCSVLYIDSLLKTMRAVPGVVPVFIPGDAMIQRARNDLFRIAYESEVETLVWIDSDQVWTPEQFAALVNDERDFVTALVRQKTEEVTFCIRKPNEADESVESCGMGFCKMSRKVIEELWSRSTLYGNDSRSVFEITIEDGELCSEDIAACHKWSGKIHYRPDIVVGHIGQKVYA